jgi:hypothetical protein
MALADFSLREQWDFVHGWHPPLTRAERQGRWQTWNQFFEDYDSIEAELIERLADGSATWRLREGQAAPFGSTIRAELHEGQVFDAHRHSSMEHAHIYVRDDQHIHEEYRRTPPLRLSDDTLYHGQIEPAIEVRSA